MSDKVRIVLHEGGETFSTLIRWQTRSRYAHASILLPNGFIIESTSRKGVALNTEPDLHKADVFRVEGLTEALSDEIVALARGYLGSKYDYLAILRFISRRKVFSNDRWFCSELVYHLFHKVGINLLHPSVEAWMVSPGLLSMSPLLIQDHRYD